MNKRMVAGLFLLLWSTTALSFEERRHQPNSFFSIALDMTEVGGDFDGTLSLYSNQGGWYDVPEVGMGFGFALAYGYLGGGPFGGEAHFRMSFQDASGYGSGLVVFGANATVCPGILRFSERSRMFVDLGANWTTLWVDQSGGRVGYEASDTADYSGIGMDILPGIELFLSQGRHPKSLRLRAGYRIINFGSVNAADIDEGLDGGTMLASLSFLFWH